MEYAIRLKGLTKSFQKEKVLKDINHDFEKGKIHGIMGFNGSGKTVMSYGRRLLGLQFRPSCCH